MSEREFCGHLVLVNEPAEQISQARGKHYVNDNDCKGDPDASWATTDFEKSHSAPDVRG